MSLNVLVNAIASFELSCHVESLQFFIMMLINDVIIFPLIDLINLFNVIFNFTIVNFKKNTALHVELCNGHLKIVQWAPIC